MGSLVIFWVNQLRTSPWCIALEVAAMGRYTQPGDSIRFINSSPAFVVGGGDPPVKFFGYTGLKLWMKCTKSQASSGLIESANEGMGVPFRPPMNTR